MILLERQIYKMMNIVYPIGGSASEGGANLDEWIGYTTAALEIAFRLSSGCGAT